jgi:hypothetical protein
MNLLRRGTNADQLRDSRVDPSKPPPNPKPLKSLVPVHKTVAEWMKSAQVIVATCATICTVTGGTVVAVVRWTVRDAIRGELAEVMAKAESAHALASALPMMREDLEKELKSQLVIHARIEAELLTLGSQNMRLQDQLRQQDKAVQRLELAKGIR